MAALHVSEAAVLPQRTIGQDVRSLDALCIVIPALQPASLLPVLVEDLAARGFGVIVVIDDGSSEACDPIFDAVAALPSVELLRHARNLGKGRALKAGFSHLLNTHPEITGVVTADADGQHTPEDIERVARALLSSDTSTVLGSRGFEHDVPLRSRLGNMLTRHVFSLLTGARLSDTQTGLRGLPRSVLPELLALEGERYEYEMNVLAHLCRRGRLPVEVPIATVYTEHNRESHFDPVWDSMRVYLVLLRLIFL